MSKTYTADDMISRGFNADFINALWCERQAVTAKEIADMSFSAADRVGPGALPEHVVGMLRALIPEPTRHLWLYDLADAAWRKHGASLFPGAQMLQALDCARRHVMGSADDAELELARETAKAAATNIMDTTGLETCQAAAAFWAARAVAAAVRGSSGTTTAVAQAEIAAVGVGPAGRSTAKAYWQDTLDSLVHLLEKSE